MNKKLIFSIAFAFLFVIVFANVASAGTITNTLNSPASGSTQYTNLVTLNATGSTTATLVNMTLYDNSTGNWGARNTTSYGTGFFGNFYSQQVYPALYADSINFTNYTGTKVPNITFYMRDGSLDTGSAYASISWHYTNGTVLFGTNQTVAHTHSTAWTIVTVANPYPSEPLSRIGLWTGGTGGTAIGEIGNFSYTYNITGASNNVFTNTYSSGANIKWNVQACDSDGACGFAPSNYTFTVDSTPPTITVNYPTSIVNYGRNGGTMQLNYTATDTNLVYCWYNYNFTNSSPVSCTTAVANLANITLTSQKNVTFYANDTAGNLGSSVKTWDYNVFENSKTYTASTAELANEQFILNTTFISGATPQYAYLVYDGTQYASTITNPTDNIYIFSNNISIPLISGSATKTFNWSITYQNSTASYNQVTDSANQTVGAILLVICNGTYTQKALNFTLKEEGTFSLLTGSLEATFDYWTQGSDGTITKNSFYANLTDNSSNYNFCIYPTTAYLTFSGIVSYKKTGYDAREYWFNQATANNITQNISLYLAATNATDTFTFTVKDESDTDISGAYVYVQRWDIGTNNFYTIGILKTSNDGTASINLRLTDAWYRYVVVYNGVTYLTTDPVKETSTSRILRVTLAEQNVYNYFYDVSHSLTFNNATNTFTFTYTDTTGAVATGCLKIIQQTVTNGSTISYQCINTASGTISYAVTANGTYTASGQLILITNYSSASSIVDSLTKSIGKPEKYTKIGNYGRVISLVAIGTAALVGVAAGSIPLGLGLIIAVMFGMMYLGFLDLRDTMWYIVSIAIMIIIAVARRSGRQ